MKRAIARISVILALLAIGGLVVSLQVNILQDTGILTQEIADEAERWAKLVGGSAAVALGASVLIHLLWDGFSNDE